MNSLFCTADLYHRNTSPFIEFISIQGLLGSSNTVDRGLIEGTPSTPTLGQLGSDTTSMVVGNTVTTVMAITRSIHQATKGLLDKAKGNVSGLEIVRDQNGITLRVSQCMFYNRKLVQTLLEGHYILSLEGSLLGDCDVEKNGKWSYIYAVGSQEYQVVCTRLDIALVGVDMLDGFDRGL
nr:zinc finger, CCHC-type [Tanacetum cinerariifolium]